ncbi:MAG: type II toxin-antitoxin system RelE/ParE family toxin [Bacteroidota bacterium]|nr:type II toxin-antitoxin system RelE/ParE family toxin [Bacteroidota bacterium]
MTDSFILLPKAQKELLDAWEWYEDRQPGLGDAFQRELHRKIKFIIANPLHYPQKGRYREAIIDVFPYLIVFGIDNSSIIIISIFHMSRHPKRKY